MMSIQTSIASHLTMAAPLKQAKRANLTSAVSARPATSSRWPSPVATAAAEGTTSDLFSIAADMSQAEDASSLMQTAQHEVSTAKAIAQNAINLLA